MIRITASVRLNTWRGQQLVDRVPRVLAAYGRELGPQLRTEIETEQFAWPRQTKRRSGRTVSSPRDIVDLGTFRDSQQLEAPARNRLRFVWDPRARNGFRYGGLLYTGYVTSKGTAVPGRNWMKPALDRKPLARFFRDNWRA